METPMVSEAVVDLATPSPVAPSTASAEVSMESSGNVLAALQAAAVTVQLATAASSLSLVEQNGNRSSSSQPPALQDLLVATVPPLVQLAVAAQASSSTKSTGQQPLHTLLLNNRICIPQGDDEVIILRAVLLQLDHLLLKCHETSPLERHMGRAPGFWTRQDMMMFSACTGLPYRTTNVEQGGSGHGLVPLVSVHAAERVYGAVKDILTRRLDYVQACDNDKSSGFCSCVSMWAFMGSSPASFVPQLSNQALEMLMCQEASEVLCQTLSLSTWNERYRSNLDDDPASLLVYHSTALQLITDRDHFMSVFVRATLAAKHSIQIATCYLFYTDPAQCYILFNLIPAVIRKGVQVQLLLDMTTAESACLQGIYASSTATPKETTRGAKNVTATSFWKHLPTHQCPPASGQEFSNGMELLQSLLQMTVVHPLFQVKFWCAQDDTEHYRVKSHVKCSVFDQELAIIGGSNLTPVIKSATGEVDCLIAGAGACGSVSESFASLWDATPSSSSTAVHRRTYWDDETKEQADSALVELSKSMKWTDPDCKVAILRSSPSCKGDDVILRVVLSKIRTARKEVFICMGHSNFCEAVVDTLAAAVERGVVARVLVNSLYSNDVWNGQQDLFLSVRKLLTRAPAVEVYATAMRHYDRPCARPEFVHAKYVTVDGVWSATGSWNMWMRSAFYEIEHEAFVESAVLASELGVKFAQDVAHNAVRVSAEDCRPGGKFCPAGCCICQGFGPFFRP